MSKPWGGIGAWAADVERAEAEEKEQQQQRANPKISVSSTTTSSDTQSFPSLKEAVATKPKKKKAMTLSEFTTGTYTGPGAAAKRDFSSSKGLTPDEMIRLPTGPKERSAEELEQGRLGGGFRNYGGGRLGGVGGPPGHNRGDDGDGQWGGGGGRRSYAAGGFDDDRDRRGPPSRGFDFDQPSRADEVDNWQTMKKPLPSMDSGAGGRNNRYRALGSDGGGSKADEVDNWAIGKKPAAAAVPLRSSTFGSGFSRDPPSTDSDRWSRGGGPPRDDSDRWARGGGPGDRDRPRIVLDPRREDGPLTEPARTNKPSPFGAARPREEILAEKGLDWRKLESDIETKKPTSSHSSRPSSAQSNRSESSVPQVLEVAPRARPKVNPFGDARPREVLLQEQGKDWRKIDLELERRPVDRPETEEEKMLKEEIDHLKKELEKEDANINGEALVEFGGQQSLHDQILTRERDLEFLILELDDKVRFGQRAADRPGSGAGRVTFPDRPPSQSGMAEESRSMDFADRPQSRGSDTWKRPGDDKRAFQGGKERVFFGNREMDRTKSSGDRW